MNIVSWRTELWHPVTVHFPLVLLLGATATYFIALMVAQQNKKTWQNATLALLVTGTAGAWLSLYTGGLADGIVARAICNPTILKDHEISARAMTYTYTVAGGLSMLLHRIKHTPLNRIASIAIALLMIVGTCLLIKTGHLGATVVYEQGGGVARHSPPCD